MEDLRFLRRDERSLILANERDEEFRLEIDDLLLSELKHASRKERDPESVKVRPREIQALVRSGKSRQEIAQLTGLSEEDIERYEGPVLAELKYILDLAHAVPVRTDASDDSDQQFGEVISERLLVLDADASEWSAWRDEETGWLVCLEFISRDVAHRALWSFDHRKSALAPVNPDAVSLSKQGEVGDRLIPKLRAVDNGARPAAPAVPAPTPAAPAAPAVATESHPTPVVMVPAAPETTEPESPTAQPVAEAPSPEQPAVQPDPNAEYARRLEIDQRAVKREDSGPQDFSQTADLLDALRRRRGERQQAAAEAQSARTPDPEMSLPSVGLPETASDVDPSTQPPAAEQSASAKKARSIWGGAGVSSDAGPARRQPVAAIPTAPDAPTAPVAPVAPVPPAAPAAVEAKPEEAAAPKKGRASIPSWDDILFGTRSDEDPAN